MSAAPTVTLRAMTSGDLPAVHAIELTAFSHPWTLTMFRRELEDPLAWTRVAVAEDARVLGFIVARFYGDMWHLMDLAASVGDRGRGVGGRLLDEFLGVVVGAGSSVTLEVRPSNEAAVALYRTRGFREVGRRPGYYPDNGEDAVIMTWWPGIGPDGGTT